MKNRSEPAAGFSLIELVVSLAITVVVIMAMLALFDRSARLNKAETAVTDAQQSSRYGSYEVVREARMSGAGGLPQSTSLGAVRQLAVALNIGSTNWGTDSKFLVNDVNASSDTVFLGGTHHVRAGTDVLHVRGVITSPVFDLTSSGWTPPSSGTIGVLVVQPCTKFTDLATATTAPCYPNGTNDMTMFADSSSYPYGRLFVMSDTFGNVGVGRILTSDEDSSAVVVTEVTLPNGQKANEAALKIDVGSATPDSTYAQTLSQGGAFPAITNPTRGGVLDDRIFFVDDGPAAGGACTAALQNENPGPCHPQLAVADWQLGDSTSAPFSTATVTPIADDVEDMQIAYGVDFYDLSTGSGTFLSPAPAELDPATGVLRTYPSDGSLSLLNATTVGNIVTAARGATAPNADPSFSTTADADEWIWNVAGEPGAGTFDRTSDLTRVKAIAVSIVAKGSNPDPQFRGPGAYAWPVMDSSAVSVSALMSPTRPFHRRVTTVRVDLRNFNIL